MTTIIIDTREPSWIQSLKFGGSFTATSALELGDFQIIRDDGIIIFVERKTASDLLGSIADGRLLNQCAGIGGMILEASRDENSRPILGVLLITGRLYPVKGKTHTEAGKSNWTWASVQGALLTVQTLGLKIYYAESDYDLEKVIISLSEKDLVGEYQIPPDKSLSKVSPTVAMLASLPGIGLQRAMKLSGITGDNFIRALKILLNPEKKVEGIGKKTTQAIRDAIGMSEKEIIAIVERVDGLEKLKE